MNISFLVNGLGEYAQAHSIASKLAQRNHEITFYADKDLILEIIKLDKFKFEKVDQVNVQEKLDSSNTDILFLCNSHTTLKYEITRPKNVKKVYSLDSNWLFNNPKYKNLGLEKFTFYEWIDKVFIVFPPSFFENNLTKNGGDYIIDESISDKLISVGFVPSAKPISDDKKLEIRNNLNLAEDDILVITYFSRPEFHNDKTAKQISIFHDFALKTISKIKEDNNKIKIVDLANPNHSSIPLPPGLLSTKDFDQIISSADLCVMHYGYGILTKALGYNIPTLCFIPKPEYDVHSHLFELKPCIDSGAIDSILFDESITDEFENKINNLLSNKEHVKQMVENQKRIYQAGEEKILEMVEV